MNMTAKREVKRAGLAPLTPKTATCFAVLGFWASARTRDDLNAMQTIRVKFIFAITPTTISTDLPRSPHHLLRPHRTSRS